MAKTKGSFYAVARGRKPGVYRTWDEAKEQTNGFRGAKHEKFPSEAEAEDYVKEFRQHVKQEPSHSQFSQVTDDIDQIEQQVGSMDIKPKAKDIEAVKPDEPWVKRLQEMHPNALVAFCAGSAPRNGQEGCTAAYAVSFPLENIPTRVVQVTTDPTNNRADCLAAEAATSIADDELDPERERVLVIYSRYQGLVFAMADHDGKRRWINRWQRNGWKTTNKKSVRHQEIYEALLKAEEHRTISWRMVDKKVDLLVQLHQQVAKSVARAAPTSAP
ncbi:hypothetical protein PHYPSEUDO_014656 [Phytophthora pseudosyringae]|uniref:ribonuclease H n=1 Tax=Phytophthora pseudosyringae TaxID=221518 RepID=A0A8T1W1N2_9STRA|nr:hypothetical protein PHYPSEUDO_014656 [Phytophthora pseudosyringae]